MRKILKAALVLGLVCALPGCGEKGPDILCTTTIVADMVQTIAGEHQKVGVLMGPGVDPHTYDPSPRDARQVKNAKLIFYSGLHLEGKMTEMLEDYAEKKPVIALVSKLDKSRILRDDQGTVDPHVWFDVALWAETADLVAKELGDYDPANKGDYLRNAEKYKAQLMELHKETKDKLESVPKEHRVLVTAHDAFEYFGRAYDIEVRAVQGISTDSEAGLKDIRNLVNFLTDRKVKAIFFESSVSNKNVRALQEGCANARPPHRVAIGGELFSDALGEPDEPGGTYIGMIRHNVQTIVEALKD